MLGTGIGKNGSRLGLSLPGFCTPWFFLFFVFLPRESQTLFLPGEKKVYREFTGWSLSDLNPI